MSTMLKHFVAMASYGTVIVDGMVLTSNDERRAVITTVAPK